ncbi:MAG: vitamin K epoxide reductase family protein [Anaerolineaceae bacterium]|nr:vitamin K epoxide reductase family protein [Anaerolineaceae bacterium]
MEKWSRKIMLVLIVVGLLVAIYMTIYKWTNNNSMCLGSGDCSTVNASPYSEIYGIPVALVGVGGYAAILFLLLMESRNDFVRQNGTLFVFGLSLTGFIFTVYLVYVEFAVLDAVCPFCLTSQIVMTIIFILSIIRLIRQPQS